MAALDGGAGGRRCDPGRRGPDALGGRLLSDGGTIGGLPARLGRRGEAELRSLPNVRILTRTTVTGAYDHGTYGALERVGLHKPARPNLPRECFWRIVAGRAILASGALERPIAFDERPPRHHDGQRGADLSQPLWRGGGQAGDAVCQHRRRARGRARDDGGGRAGGRDHRPAPRCQRGRGLPGASGRRGGRHPRPPWACAITVRKGTESSRSRPIAWPCRAAGTRRCT
jgi:hypothetical protein